MRVAELWRFPVKSLQGEQVDTAELGPGGIRGDREYALFDVATGFGLTARREPDLLFADARCRDDGSVEITLPDGTIADDDEALSAWIGRPVRLCSTDQVTERRYETPGDIEHESAESWNPFVGASGAFHDTDGATVTLLSRSTMNGEPTRRFRANIVLDGTGEDSLVGMSVQVGDALVKITQQIARCIMVTRPQPGGIELDREVLRRIHRERGGLLAVGGTVTRPGTTHPGDTLTTT